MSRYIILQEPHPLDAVWDIVLQAVETAAEGVDALGGDFEDSALDVAMGNRNSAVYAVMALPARNLDDIIHKLMLTGIEYGSALAGCDISAILNEACLLVSDGIQRGAIMRRDQVRAVATSLAIDPSSVDDFAPEAS